MDELCLLGHIRLDWRRSHLDSLSGARLLVPAPCALNNPSLDPTLSLLSLPLCPWARSHLSFPPILLPALAFGARPTCSSRPAALQLAGALVSIISAVSSGHSVSADSTIGTTWLPLQGWSQTPAARPVNGFALALIPFTACSFHSQTASAREGNTCRRMLAIQSQPITRQQQG
ncbi:hypothetical protein K437DRAFT_48028 [Tilletiaria anomala UBC 951]|uniref:Uncharacterized protein n=1 Tax=Tilletiaria anomala (strain ATCC 24038 / CBS 436.72 / UBC 951) TaxID=1037660 RepID=A0A066V9D0_TILAU|nr:uncharacterized protein K437DRAFT_48028 [Tilletiaria anomala UBC 951]KDN36883.1 hypothetical protein K437DRAFT_48028 [Tilletiaria anomala UBC 951]